MTRPHFQFRLRTLFVVVTIACIYLGWEAKIVRDRKAMLEISADGPVVDVTLSTDKDAALPLVRRWLGDHFCRSVYLKQSADIARYKSAFPEADVDLGPPPPPPAPYL